MKIKKIGKSRLNNTDFTNLPFGKIFSDHMLVCYYKEGRWLKPRIQPYAPIQMNPGTQVLHYGQSVFEGMKAFKNQAGKILLFRERDNFLRLNRSAARLSIPEIPEDIFINGLNNLLNIDSNWCKSEDGYSLYIRPFIFASSECIKASSAKEFTFIIITSPTLNYYTKPINLVIESYYARSIEGGVGFAKAAGNYASSFFPTLQANARGFTQVVWTDAKYHKYIEESGTMNIWFRINNKLVTPQLSDRILAGITRDSIIKLARYTGIEVEERVVSVVEIEKASDNGSLKEVFGTGTAVTVAPVESITFRDRKMCIKDQEKSFALELKKNLQDIQNGRCEDIFNWTNKLIA